MACPEESTFEAYFAGDLPADLAVMLAEHAEECRACGAKIARLARDVDTVDAGGVDVDDPTAAVSTASPAEKSDLPRRPPRTGRGTRLGRFVLEQHLGTGGMGIVYTALDPELGRKVAIKLLRAGVSSAEARQRLMREAQAMARLSHPNVITVYEVGTFGERVFVAMEYVDGQTLRHWLKQGPHDLEVVLDRFLQAGRGLEAAHAAGIIHRDFKPANVLVGRDGRPRVLDFGLARGADEGEVAAGSSDSWSSQSWSTDSDLVTRTGAILGTPAYMAPEQRRGERATAASDQFNYCVALYEGLYGERPFRSDAGGGATSDDRWRPRPPPAGSRVHAALRKLLLRGLAFEPQDRFASMTELLAAVERARGARRRAAWLGAAVGVTALVGATVVYAATRPAADACAGMERRLLDVWDPARRSAVHAAFRATRTPFAEASFTALARTLDAYAAAWTDRRARVCRALRGRPADSSDELRVACLDQRLANLDAFVRLFDGADATLVSRAAEAAAGLDDVALCDSPKGAFEPAPQDPDKRRRVREVRARLARVRTLDHAGKTQGSRAALDDLLGEARALAYRPLEGEVLLEKGYLLGATGELKDADDVLHQAVAIAEETHDDDVKANGWTWLVYTAAQARRLDEAHRYARIAEAVVRTTDDRSQHRMTELEAIEGVAYRVEGNLGESLRLMASSVARAEKAREADDPTLGILVMNYGAVLADAGRLDESQAQSLRAMAIFEKALGTQHPYVAQVLNNLADVAHKRGDIDKALGYLEHALAIKEAYLPPDNVSLAVASYNLADILHLKHRDDEALPLYRRAKEIFRKKAGKDSPYVAAVVVSEAQILLARGRGADVIDELEPAVAVREAQKGVTPGELAEARFLLGRALVESGRDPARGLEWVEKARAGLAAESGEDAKADLLVIDDWRKAHGVQ